MNKIDLRRIDLNLLLLFDVLMQVGSVSKAADQLGRTQSAASHALGRLREQLGDPLLVKVGGRMQPSPYAMELVQEVRPILRSIERVLSPREAFEPSTAKRRFRLAVPDLAMGLFPTLIQRIQREAPGVQIDWETPRVWLIWLCCPMQSNDPMASQRNSSANFNGHASCARGTRL